MARGVRYTKEQEGWIKENVLNKSYNSLEELTIAFNTFFDSNRSKAAIGTKLGKDMGLKLNTGNPFSEEELLWIKENHRKYSSLEKLLIEHNKIFPKRTESSMRQILMRNNCLTRKWDKEEDNWILNNYFKFETIEELLKHYNNEFDRQRTLKGFSLHCQKRLKLKRFVPYSDEENMWIIDNINNYTYEDLSKEFNKKFGRSTTSRAMQTYCHRKLNTGKENPALWSAANRKPIGHIITLSGGYIYVKVKDYIPEHGVKRKVSEMYESLARVKWKEYHGREVPEDCQIIYLDSDKNNFSEDNLYCIKKKYLVYMIRNHWFSEIPEVTMTAIKYCELMYSLQDDK